MGENDGKMSRSNLHGVQSSRPLHMQGTASETNSLKKKKKKTEDNQHLVQCLQDPEGGPGGRSRRAQAVGAGRTQQTKSW